MTTMAVVGSKATKESQTLVFSGAPVDEVADKVAIFMAGRGYQLESGNKLQGVYGRGSTLGHFLVGPLAKRNKYNITVAKDDENVAVVVSRAMSGLAGGIWAASKVKKEFLEICNGIQSTLLGGR